MRHDGRLDHARALHLDFVGTEIVEQADTAAEQKRREMDLQLVDQSGPQELLNGVRTAANRDVLVTGGRLRLINCRLNALGDEGEGCSPFLCLLLARLLSRFVSPPSRP